MLILTAPAAIRHAIACCAQAAPAEALGRYAAMLDTEPIALLYVLQPGDTAGCLEQQRGRPFEGWEYIDDLGGWFEAVFVIGDDGFGHVVLIPDQPGSDPALLEICRANCT